MKKLLCWTPFLLPGMLLGQTSPITVTPSSLAFVSTGTNPPPRTLSVTAPATTFFTVSVINGGNWLSANPATGSTPGTVTASVNVTGLPSNSYSATISIFGGGVTRTIPVTLSHTASQTTTITPSPTSLTFNTTVGVTPSPQNLSVSSSPSGASLVLSSDSFRIIVTPSSGTAPANFSVSANVNGLAVGTYSSIVQISAGSGVFANVPVTINVAQAPSVTISTVPDNLSFTADVGALSAPQSLSIQSSPTGRSMSVTASVPWLSFSPSGGLTPFSVSVRASAANLSAGTYTGSITVSIIEGPSKVVPVTFVVRQTTLTANPQSLTFNTTVGVNPASQNLTISSSVSGLAVAMSTATPWLRIAPSSGNAPASFSISVNVSGLAAGTYGGSIRASAGLGEIVLDIPVTLNIGSVGITTLPDSLTFTADVGALSAQQSLTVQSTPTGRSMSVSVSVPWLSFSPSGGTTPFSISVRASAANLAAGTYTGSLTVSIIEGPSRVIPVTFIVRDITLTANPQSLTFNTTVGVNPAAQTLTVSTSAPGFTIAISSTTPWLVLQPASAPTPATFSISVNVSGLAAGTYNGSITAITSGRDFSIDIPVTLNIGQITLTTSPDSLSFVANVGGLSENQQLSVSSNPTGRTVTLSGGPSWLTFTPLSGVTPVPFTLRANAAGLSAGTFEATITVSLAGGPSRNIPVSLTVRQGLTITGISPQSRPANSGDFDLVITGSGFTSGLVAFVGAFSTGSLNPSVDQITVRVPNSAIATPGNYPVFVEVGSQRSNIVTLRITAPSQVNSILPQSRPVGSAAFELTVNGVGFPPGANILFGNNTISPTLRSETSLVGSVPASLLTTPGIIPVRVQEPGGVPTNSVDFTVVGAATIDSIDPTTRTAGSGQFDMRIIGAGFTQGARVQFGSTTLDPLTRSDTEITVRIPANLITTAGTRDVTVVLPGNLRSNTVTFRVSGFTISSLNPNSRTAGSGDFDLQVNGEGFLNDARVIFDTTALNPTGRSAIQLTVRVPATLIAAARTLNVQVEQGGTRSNTLPFTVTVAPTLRLLNPTSRVAGSGAFTLTLTGTNFAAGTRVLFGATPLDPATRTDTEITVAIPVAETTTARTVAVRVVSASGEQSEPQNFQFTAAARPVIMMLAPNSRQANGGAFELVVMGQNFAAGSSIRFGTSLRASTLTGTTSIRAQIDNALIATPGAIQVVVEGSNGTSDPATFSVTAPSTINPGSPNVMPGQGSSVSVSIAQPAPAAIAGTLQLLFQPNATGLPANYANRPLQFTAANSTNNGKNLDFTIAMGQTNAVIPNAGAFNAGTVAGNIIVRMTRLVRGTENILPNPPPETTIAVPQSAPGITPGSVRIIPRTGGFAVELMGHSSPRDMVSATFTFTPRSDVDLEDTTPIRVTTELQQEFTRWFGSAPGQDAGSAFKLTVPFTFSSTDLTLLQSVTVTLQNSRDTAQGSGTR